MTKAPDYRWVCHRCHEPNPPGIAVCEKCGMPAVVSARDLPTLERVKPAIKPSQEHPSFAIYFPEIVLALIAVLASPYWAYSLALQGYIVAAIGLLLVATGGTYGFFWCFRKGYRWSADWVLIGILLGFLGISETTKAAFPPFVDPPSQARSCEK